MPVIGLELETQKTFQEIDTLGKQPASTEPEEARRFLYGRCLIDVPVKSIPHMLFVEILNPFYVIQLLAILLWYNFEYEIYATFILVTSLISIVISLVQTR